MKKASYKREEEDQKRKRDERRESEERESPFTKSLKIQRSPEEKIKEKEMEVKEMFERLLEEISQIKSNHGEMKREIEEVRKELEEVRKEKASLRAEVVELKELIKGKENTWNKEKDQLIGKVNEMEEKMEKMEKNERKKNIVITGLIGEGMNQEVRLQSWIEKELGVIVGVEEMYEVNGKLIAKIKTWEEKRKIMLNKSKLRSKMGSKVFIDDDLTVKERVIQKKIRVIANAERNKGNEVKVGYKKLRINGKLWMWKNDLDGIGNF